MGVDEPGTQSVEAAETPRRWRELLDRVGHGRARIIVAEGGVPIAAIVSTQDLDRLARFDTERRAQFAPLDATWAAFADVPADEIEREVARAIAEARQANRLPDLPTSKTA